MGGGGEQSKSPHGFLPPIPGFPPRFLATDFPEEWQIGERTWSRGRGREVHDPSRRADETPLLRSRHVYDPPAGRAADELELARAPSGRAASTDPCGIADSPIACVMAMAYCW